MNRAKKIEFRRRKLLISTHNGESARYYSDLMYVRFDKPYCHLHFKCGTKYYVEIPVNELIDRLPKKPFFLCNRADIINLCYYEGYESVASVVSLEGGAEFKLSSRRMTEFKKKKDELKRISPPCYSEDERNRECPDFALFCLGHSIDP